MQDELLIYISKQLNMAIEILKRQEKQPTNKIGRPTKEHIVVRYRQSYPNASKRSCARATGLSTKTVRKHWESYQYHVEMPVEK